MTKHTQLKSHIGDSQQPHNTITEHKQKQRSLLNTQTKQQQRNLYLTQETTTQKPHAQDELAAEIHYRHKKAIAPNTHNTNKTQRNIQTKHKKYN